MRSLSLNDLNPKEYYENVSLQTIKNKENIKEKQYIL